MSDTAFNAVLFDLDDTLADRTGAFRSWCSWYVDSVLGLTSPEERREAQRMITALDGDGRGSKDVMFTEITRHYPQVEGAIDALVSTFRLQLRDCFPAIAPDARGVLDALTAHGIPWGIVTNGSPLQYATIEKIGIGEIAKHIWVSDVVGVRKPDPRIFSLAIAGLDSRPETTLFVGDHPQADVLGASACGLATGWVSHGRTWPLEHGGSPTFTFASIAAMRPLIEGW